MMRRSFIPAIPLLCLALSSCVPWTVRPINRETSTAPGQTTLTAAAYVDSIWSAKLVPQVLATAVDARVLLDALATAPEEATDKYGHQQAGGPAYFIVKGRGLVVGVDTSSRSGLALVDVPPYDRRPDLSIQIGPVLRGASLRDATGIARFSDFVNQLEFADVGNELNARVLKTVLAALDKDTLAGREVEFAGTLAVEIGTEPPMREMVPVKLIVEEAR